MGFACFLSWAWLGKDFGYLQDRVTKNTSLLIPPLIYRVCPNCIPAWLDVQLGFFSRAYLSKIGNLSWVLDSQLGTSFFGNNCWRVTGLLLPWAGLRKDRWTVTCKRVCARVSELQRARARHLYILCRIGAFICTLINQGLCTHTLMYPSLGITPYFRITFQ
jgi:hypothetical protein